MATECALILSFNRLKRTRLLKIETWGESGYLNLSLLLAHLPPKTVFNELGPDALYWTWVKYPYVPHKDKIAGALAGFTGKDPEMLEKARLSAWRMLHNKDARDVKSIDRLIEYVNSGRLGSFPLKEQIRLCSKPGFSMQERENQYLLSAMNTEKHYPVSNEVEWGRMADGGGNKRFSVYLDAPVGIGLMHKGLPAAAAGLLSSASTLMIYQLQGIQPHIVDENGKEIGRASSRGLMPIDWQRILVNCAGFVASELGLEEICLRSGYNNKWTKKYEGDGKIHLKLEDALAAYDRVAERLGFEQRDDKNWYKAANSLYLPKDQYADSVIPPVVIAESA